LPFAALKDMEGAIPQSQNPARDEIVQVATTIIADVPSNTLMMGAAVVGAPTGVMGKAHGR
jgi:hypothetical protein